MRGFQNQSREEGFRGLVPGGRVKGERERVSRRVRRLWELGGIWGSREMDQGFRKQESRVDLVWDPGDLGVVNFSRGDRRQGHWYWEVLAFLSRGQWLLSFLFRGKGLFCQLKQHRQQACERRA